MIAGRSGLEGNERALNGSAHCASHAVNFTIYDLSLDFLPSVAIEVVLLDHIHLP